jgi:hypothetical protein
MWYTFGDFQTIYSRCFLQEVIMQFAHMRKINKLSYEVILIIFCASIAHILAGYK